jgi:predicted  nucleic acid-binding Zn-ribbon protein
MTTASVAQAQAMLAQAEEAQRAERRAQLVAQLKTTRSELRTQQQALENLKRQVFKGQAALDNILREQQMYLNALGANAQRKPACAEMLPDDPDVVAWRMRETDLEANLARLREQRAALPNLELLRGDGVLLAHQVQALQYAESNILNTLTGSLATKPEGGVFAPQ